MTALNQQQIEQPLKKQLAQDICAQQVITTIVDSIKELVDNSIDAKAKRIEIVLEDYGKKSIQVTDDGHGISNLQILGGKGTTSKNEGNYSNISTLGFRGQALHSLARVSYQMHITTTTNALSTYHLNLKTQEIEQIIPHRQMGTNIRIVSLFEYLPVRRLELINKFRQHVKKIDEMIKQYALIYPRISFILKNNKSDKQDILVQTSICLNKPKQQLWKIRIAEVLGLKISMKLVYVDKPNIEGWLLRNIESGSGNQNNYIRRHYHYMYINERPIDPLPKIVEHLNLIYKKYKKSTKYIFILNIKLDWQNYDVNLAPNKRQILIKDSVVKMVNKQLSQFIQKNVVEEIIKLQEFNQTPKLRINSKMTKQIDKIVEEQQQVQQEIDNQNQQVQNQTMQEHKDDHKNINIGTSKQQEKNREDDQIDHHQLQSDLQKIKISDKNSTINIMRTDQSLWQKKSKDRQKTINLGNSELVRQLNERMSRGSKNIEYIRNKHHKPNQQNIVQSLFRETQIKNQENSKNNEPEQILQRKKQNSQPAINKKQNNQTDKDGQSYLYPRNNNKEENNFQQQQNQKLNQSRPTQRNQIGLGKWLEKRASHTLQKSAFNQFKILGQFNRGFIVCTYNQQYYLIDQHAASQKYNYETLMNKSRTQVQCFQKIQLTALEKQSLSEFEDQLRQDGYQFEIQQNQEKNSKESNQIILTRIPTFLEKVYGKQYFMYLLENKMKLSQHRDYYMYAASKACRTAIMVGDTLNKSEMLNIVRELSNLQSPWNCPHGRPTLIMLGSIEEIENSINNPQDLQNYELL